MAGIEIRELAPTRAEVRRFVRFAAEVYREIPQWVPPIYSVQEKAILSGPFTAIGEYRLLMAHRNGHPVARLSVHRNFSHDAYYGTRQGFFGFFEALPDAEAVRELFEVGERWLAAQGCGSAQGPCSFSVYEEIGTLVDCFGETPVILCPYNPPYYPDLLESIGYKREVDWFAFQVMRDQPLPERWEKIARHVLSRPNVSIRPARLADWEQEINLVRGIFNEAWAENWGHVPLSDAEWRVLAEDLKLVIHEELCLIMMVDGQPVGFSLTLPDLNLAIQHANGRLFPFGLLKILWEKRRIRSLRTIAMGILKAHRGHGYEVALIVETIHNGRRLGYEKCDCSLVVETNRRMIGVLEALGAERYKTFRVFKKELAPPPGG